MKIGILDESIIKKIVTEILIGRPEVINVFVEGTELIIESDDIDSLVEYLDKEHGLHLIVNGDNYMIASKINEGLAQEVAEAGAKAADAASKGLVSKTKEFMKKKREEVGEPLTDAEKSEQAREEAEDATEKGHSAVTDEVEDVVRKLGAVSQQLSPDELEKILQTPGVKKALMMRKNKDFFVKLGGASQKKKDSVGDSDGNMISLPNGQKIEVRLADINRSSKPILE